MIKIILVTPSPARYPRFMAGLAQPDRAVLQRTGKGEKALLAARTDRPNLVVLDEQISDLAGPELVRRLLSQDASIGVAVISSRDSEDFQEAYEGLGVLAQLPQNPGLNHARQLLDQVEQLEQAMFFAQD
jgi:DNA-binding response OmpR family regulator